jgi:hypothetical protein
MNTKPFVAALQKLRRFLPWPIRRILALHWIAVGNRRAEWSETIAPELRRK